jgi:hypothetical protein
MIVCPSCRQRHRAVYFPAKPDNDPGDVCEVCGAVFYIRYHNLHTMGSVRVEKVPAGGAWKRTSADEMLLRVCS